MAPVALFAREGAPSYYRNAYSTQPRQYQPMPNRYPGQNIYAGPQQNGNIINQHSYTYQVPKPTAAQAGRGAATPNGIGIPPENNKYDLAVTASYTRKFADFQFETGVQSILEWDDMILNLFGIRAEKDFQLRGFNLFGFGEYAYGSVSHGGLSMDYDLKPYNDAQPASGIFTISMGGQTGTIQDLKFGIGARHIWDISGWKISPIIGYQIFKHDLKMNNHVYPNPAVYLPLMNQFGDYIYGDTNGNYYSAPQGTAVPDGYHQVCISPEDIALAAADPSTHRPIVDENGNLMTDSYDPLYEYQPWGVGPGQCVVVGGDGMIIVNGVTHIYNTTWSGIYLAVEIEKQMTYVDKLRFYAQASMPHYRSEGIWPNRTDWQQNPSFVDEGNNGAMQYRMEMEYIYHFSDRLQLSAKAETSYFHIGKVGGELYVAGYQYYETDPATGEIVYVDPNGVPGDGDEYPYLATKDPYTEKITDSLKNATWQSFGLHFGVKYTF